jgi:DNA topoisomerase I
MGYPQTKCQTLSTNRKYRLIEPGTDGYTRRRAGTAWQYRSTNGRVVRSSAVVDRLDKLALPPAYHDAWFARDPKAHIQATGIDKKGRKQYRYHADFVAERDAEKYDGCVDFGAALPKLRRQVERDLARRNLSRERVIAAIIRLLDLGSVRVGNAAYAKQNRSFGATTLRNRHAKVRGAKLMLDYVGKSGKSHSISVEDARLARLVRKCQELPGQMLFQFVNADGARQSVTSTDVNDYLRQNMGDFTAKHFRTWSASVLAFQFLIANEGKSSLKAMLAHVSEKLGNTPAIARKSYVHPNLIAAAGDGALKSKKMPRTTRFMSGPERGLMQFLDS